jgi:NitT/TauT family transport system permease protein
MRFKTVILPASVPFILTGARLGTGRALVGVVVAEFLASNGGIGFYISLNGSLLQSARVYFGIVLLGIIGVALGELVRVIEKRFDRWRPAIR